MGGIPYTSGGCGTCRRRKVKCDETRPECLRCTNYGHQCTGYDKKRVFVIGRPGATARKNAKLVPDSNLALIKAPEIDALRPNVNPELRSQLLTTFIESYAPGRPYLQDSTGRNLLQTLPEIVRGSLILEKAGICLAAGFLASQNQDDRLLQYSSKLYGNTLRTLHGKITSGANLGQDMLYTTVLLQIYELINCSPPGFGAWIAHVQGGVAISTQTSAQGGGSVAERLFHRQLKYVTLCDAIGKRKTPYLYNTPLWRSSYPHEGEPDPIDQFIDLLAECCAIMDQVEKFFVALPDASSESTRDAGDQLLRTCLCLEEKLHRACVSMQQEIGLPRVSTVPLGGFRDTLSTVLFSGTFDFPSLTCAESHIAYWTILNLLYSLIGELSFILDKPPQDVSVTVYGNSTNSDTTGTHTRTLSADGPAAYTGLAEHYAGEICRSVLYFIQPDMKTLGAQLLLAPFSQCVQFYIAEGLTAKLKWCQDVLEVISDLGLGIAPFLKHMIWPQYRNAQERRHSLQKLLES
ncbi:Zn(II)2Cys6 transcription factor domain-containing protein [Aspergillus undulatus]|uniref:Zn(II)2Cys6 transcription factor domain-containing protein n=1 Tax=Aspergillus undulatus TaxID=1810928 RepID=UPI003CCDCD45